MKYFSMFSGIGGFELGIQQATNNKWECIGYSEINNYAIKVYNSHFNHKNYGDATKLDANSLPEFDLLVGGFPCQSFSMAGKRKGFEDTRGTLFFDIARIITNKRPRYILLENVQGLLSHDGGKTFQTILKILSNIGYRVEWQLLNSKDYGVPQSRERIFIIGYLGKGSRPKIFPISKSGELYNQSKKTTKRLYESTRTITSQTDKNGTGSFVSTLTARQFSSWNGNYIKAVISPDRLNKNQNGRRIKEVGDPMFSLTSQDRHGIYNGKYIRKLTPIECERLQGFPDNWTQDISETQRYKALGNAVTVNVVESIINRFKTIEY